jgi:hypothetical protein
VWDIKYVSFFSTALFENISLSDEYLVSCISQMSAHSDRAVQGMKCLRPFERLDLGSNPTQGMDVLPAVIVCLSCVGPTDCLRFRNLSETKRFTNVLCPKWEQQE